MQPMDIGDTPSFGSHCSGNTFQVYTADHRGTSSSDDVASFTSETSTSTTSNLDDRNEATDVSVGSMTPTGPPGHSPVTRPMDPDLGSTSTSRLPCCHMQTSGSLENPAFPISSTSDIGTPSYVSKTGSRLVYTSERHPRCSLQAMSTLREKRELCDAVLVVDDRSIYTHRVVLAACSPYFRAMFTGELAESRQSEITLYDLDGSAVETLISFCYTSQITVEEGNVQNLLPAACLLQLIEIQDVCCEFLKRQLDPSNCLGIRAFADTHACSDLLKVADRYVHVNFLDVIESEEFLLLPFNQLANILNSDELNVRSEEVVYRALMRWLHQQLPERRRHLSHLLQYIRLPFLSPKFLVSTVGADMLIRSDERCRDLVDEAKNYLLLPQERASMQGPQTRPREPTAASGGGSERLFAVGGWCSGDAIASAEYYDPRSHEWQMVAPMQKRRCGVGVGVVNDLLYAVGGHDGQSYLNSVERYDPHTNQWSSDIAPTSTCRTSVGVAVLNGIMYAVGGQDGVSCLSMVERHDPVVNKWSKVSSMSTRRLGVGVAVLNGQLYAVGGSDGQQPLSSVEHFDPRVGVWHRMTCMGTRRKHLGVAVYNNLIYAVGGRDEIMEVSAAECFDPRNCSWSPVVAMMSRRSGVGLAVVNNQLTAIGGFDGATYLKTVEVYDRDANCWRIRGCMNSRRLGGGVGVIHYANCSGYSGDVLHQQKPLSSSACSSISYNHHHSNGMRAVEDVDEVLAGNNTSTAHSQPIPPGLSVSLMPSRSTTAAGVGGSEGHLTTHPNLTSSMIVSSSGGLQTGTDLTRVTPPASTAIFLSRGNSGRCHMQTGVAAAQTPVVVASSTLPAAAAGPSSASGSHDNDSTDAIASGSFIF